MVRFFSTKVLGDLSSDWRNPSRFLSIIDFSHYQEQREIRPTLQNIFKFNDYIIYM